LLHPSYVPPSGCCEVGGPWYPGRCPGLAYNALSGLRTAGPARPAGHTSRTPPPSPHSRPDPSPRQRTRSWPSVRPVSDAPTGQWNKAQGCGVRAATLGWASHPSPPTPTGLRPCAEVPVPNASTMTGCDIGRIRVWRFAPPPTVERTSCQRHIGALPTDRGSTTTTARRVGRLADNDNGSGSAAPGDPLICRAAGSPRSRALSCARGQVFHQSECLAAEVERRKLSGGLTVGVHPMTQWGFTPLQPAWRQPTLGVIGVFRVKETTKHRNLTGPWDDCEDS
jgi:hypothetical protein